MNPFPTFAFRVCAPTRVGALRLYPVLLSGLRMSNLFSIKNPRLCVSRNRGKTFKIKNHPLRVLSLYPGPRRGRKRGIQTSKPR